MADGVVEAGWLGVLALTAVHVDVYAGASVETTKAVLVRSLAVVVGAAWLLLEGGGGRDPAHRWRRALGAAVAALLLVTLVSTATSVAPLVSLLGSADRAQGLLTLAAVVVVGGTVAARLQRQDQWDRLVTVVGATAVIVALVAVLQGHGDDPLPSAGAEGRPSSTLGTPTALAAWLVLAGVLLAGRLARRLRELPGAVPRPLVAAAVAACAAAWSASPGIGVVATVVVLAAGSTWGAPRWGPLAPAAADATALGALAAAVILSGARGPVLGLAAAVAVVGAAAGARRGRGRRGALVVGAVAAAVLLAVAVAAVGPTPWRQVPLVGRVAALDLGEGSPAVRTVLWDTAVDAMTSASPLWSPTGEDDRHELRWLLGYGPDAAAAPLGQVAPARLWRLEQPTAMPDRAHNAVLDDLVATGILGVVASLAVVTAAVALGLSRLGLLATDRRRITFAATWTGGALLGLAAAAAADAPHAAGVALVGGALAGLVTWLCTVGPSSTAGTGAGDERGTAVLALLAVVVAYWVETQSGIASVATLATVAVAIGALASPFAAGRKPLTVPVIEPGAGNGAAAVTGAAIGVVGAAVIAGPGLGVVGVAAAGCAAVLVAALLTADTGSPGGPAAATRSLVVVVGLAGAVVLPRLLLLGRAEAGDVAAAAWGAALVMALVIGTTLAAGGELAAAPGVSVTDRGDRHPRAGQAALAASAAVAVVVVGIAPAAASAVREQALAAADRAAGVRWLDRAHQLDPWSDGDLSARARGHLLLARDRSGARTDDDRAASLSAAEAASLASRRRHPFDPLRTAALAGLHSHAGDLMRTATAAERHRELAVRSAADVVRMQPASALARMLHADALQEWSDVLDELGDDRAADARERADVELAVAERLRPGILGRHGLRPTPSS